VTQHPDLIPEPDDKLWNWEDDLDEIDKIVEGITDEEVDEHLRKVLESRKCQCKGLTACPCRPCDNHFTQEDWLCDPCRLWKHDADAQRDPHCHPKAYLSHTPYALYERTFTDRVPFPGAGKTSHFSPEDFKPDLEAANRYMSKLLDPEAIRRILKNWKGTLP